MFDELERTLLDQIEKLNDEPIDGDADREKAEIMVAKSRAISDLTDRYVALNRLKLDIAVKAEENGVVYRQMLETGDGSR